MGDRVVTISLIEPRIKSMHPTVKRAIVSADDPYEKSSEPVSRTLIRLTASFATVQSYKDTHCAS
jgi:hypothetical protein